MRGDPRLTAGGEPAETRGTRLHGVLPGLGGAVDVRIGTGRLTGAVEPPAVPSSPVESFSNDGHRSGTDRSPVHIVCRAVCCFVVVGVGWRHRGCRVVVASGVLGGRRWSCGPGGGEVRGRFGVFGVMNRCGETER